MLLAVGHEFSNGDAKRQLGVEPLVGRQQAFGERQGRDLAHDLVDGARRKRVGLTLVVEAVCLQ